MKRNTPLPEFELQINKHNINKMEFEVREVELDEWIPVAKYAPEFVDTELDIPQYSIDPEYFQFFISNCQQNNMVYDVLLVHKVIESGKPNRYRCKIPVDTRINVELFQQWLLDYEDLDVIQWIKYGFSVSRDDSKAELTPNKVNHMGANMYLDCLDAYVENEVKLGVTLGPFKIPPFISRIGISPLSTRPKRESMKRIVILDLSFLQGASVNDGISKDVYCGQEINLTYPTIDTLAKRIFDLSKLGEVWMWKKDLLRAFRQINLCPMDFSLIGYRWRNLLYFDEVVPMGLRSAAYICQRLTNAVRYMHNQCGYWSLNYLDDFGSAELKHRVLDSYNLMAKIFKMLGIQEAEEKSVEPTTRMEFLGNMVDTKKFTLEVSPDRKKELFELIQKFKNKEELTKKQLQSLIGKLSFVTNCVRPGRIFLNRMLEKLRSCSNLVKIDVEFRRDLIWWEEFLPKFDGISLLWLRDEHPHNQLMASDASMVGGGGTHKEEFFHIKFNQQILEQTNNIAQRELYTIMIAVKLWGSKMYGQVVRFDTDNQISMFAVNTGRTRDHFLLKCLREIALYATRFQCILRA